jgi:hypothetical protein
MGFGLVIGFIEQLYTQLITTSNCSAIANSHTLQFTTAPTKSSQCAVSSAVVWQQLPMVDVPVTQGSRTVPMP